MNPLLKTSILVYNMNIIKKITDTSNICGQCTIDCPIGRSAHNLFVVNRLVAWRQRRFTFVYERTVLQQLADRKIS